MGVAPRQDYVDLLRLMLKRINDLRRIEHAVTDGVVDLIQNHEIPICGKDGRSGFGPGLLYHANVFRIGFSAAHFHETAAHLLHHEVVAECLHRIELAIVPRALQKLEHQHFHAVAHGAESSTHGCRSLTLTRTSVDDDQSAMNVIHA